MADNPIDSKTARRAGTPAKPKEGESWGELAKTVIYAGLIAIVIRTFLFQPFNIPSASMEATLLVGDYLFVEKFSYGYSRYTFPFGGWPFGDMLHGRFPDLKPHRGDVIVFKFPRRQFHRLHQAADRPSRRPYTNEKRSALAERQADPQGARRRLCRRHRRRASSRAAISRDPAGRQKLSGAGPRPRRARGQYRRLCRAAGPLFHDGRQSRQLRRQPRPKWAMSPPKIWKARRFSASSRPMATPISGKCGSGRSRSAIRAS